MRVFAPAVVGVRVHVPAATVPVHESVASLTGTSPDGVPLLDVTVKVTAIASPTTDGSRPWPAIVLALLPPLTVSVRDGTGVMCVVPKNNMYSCAGPLISSPH